MDNKQNINKELHDNVDETVKNLYKYVQSEKLDFKPVADYHKFTEHTQKYKISTEEDITPILYTISDDDEPKPEVNNNFKKTNDPSKIKSSKKRPIIDIIDLTKEIEVIDLTQDDSPVKKRICDNNIKENDPLELGLEFYNESVELPQIEIQNNEEVPEPVLFVEVPLIETQNNQENNQVLDEKLNKEQDTEDNVPSYTFRDASDLLSKEYKLINEVIGKQKIVTMKNFDILNKTVLISKSPLLYRFEDQEFSLVRIVGTIRGIEPTTTSKTVLTVDDGSFIKVIFENSKEKHKIREKIVDLIHRTSRHEKLSKEDLIKYAKMPELQYAFETPQETREKLMSTFTNILIKKLYAKLEIQFPRKFVVGQQVEITGRLLPRNPKTFIYSEDLYIIYVHFLKRIVSDGEYVCEEHELRNNELQELISQDVDVHERFVDILDDPND